ncbi:TPA: amino acid--tRNA ligase-related protein, partial [Legionella pneumophila]
MSDNSWLPSASIQLLRARAELIGKIRQFFTERQYLEVETPVMAR